MTICVLLYRFAPRGTKGRQKLINNSPPSRAQGVSRLCHLTTPNQLDPAIFAERVRSRLIPQIRYRTNLFFCKKNQVHYEYKETLGHDPSYVEGRFSTNIRNASNKPDDEAF